MTTRRAALAAISFAALAAGAFSPAWAQDSKGTIGIAMPTQSSARWISDGNSMVEQFEAAGYDAVLQYAEDDIPTQLNQVENMISQGVDALVVAAIDGTTLSGALENAAAAGIPVIAYDRLIRDSENVDYYATFDNFQVGVLQANSLVQCLQERFPDQKPWNVELFGGSPDDNNAFFFYDGAMSVLQPLIDAGDIVVPSGQMGMDVVGTLRWDGAVAQSRMDNLLSANYGDKDAEVPSVKSILTGEQHSTVFKDTRELARVTVGMVDSLLQGGEPEINDTETYDNGVKVVPSYLLVPLPVDASNYEEALVGSGYYTADQLQ
jgi:putative multiple sugar transport system substrate-binding protein